MQAQASVRGSLILISESFMIALTLKNRRGKVFFIPYKTYSDAIEKTLKRWREGMKTSNNRHRSQDDFLLSSEKPSFAFS